MNILEVHIEGGVLFMSILSILLLSVLATGIGAFVGKKVFLLKISQEIGLFALVWGILGQLIGLFAAFQAIEMVGEVSQGILAGGLKVSSYTTIYGLIVFLIAKLVKLAFLAKNKA